MAKKISVNVIAKNPVISECVKFTAGQNITDQIEKDKEYSGNSGKTATFKNYCTTPFNVPEIILYSNTENGGNFKVYISSFPINDGATLNIPIKYSGIYKGSASSLNFSFTYNGIPLNYNISVTVPVVHTPPTVSNITKNLSNRLDYTFVLSDFTNAFNSIDNANLSSITINSTNNNFKLNNVIINTPTEITVAEINSGLFKFTAPDTNNTSSLNCTIYVKDSNGLMSLTSATIAINNTALCTPPTLTDITINSNNSVTYAWNNNGINYGSGTTLLQFSIDGGTSYALVATVSPNSSPYTVTSPLFDNISNGQTVKFRIINYGGYCSDMISNVVDKVFNKQSEVKLTRTSSSNGIVNFNIEVLNAQFDGKYEIYIDNNTQLSEISGYINDSLEYSDLLAPSKKVVTSIPVGTHQMIIQTDFVSANFDATSWFRILKSNDDFVAEIECVYISQA